MPAQVPNFLVLGAPKCGTTSLCHYLAQHPDVYVPEVKEPRFFDAEYEKGLDYYRSTYFSGWSGESRAGEGRVFLLFLPFVPARIRESLPDARLIAILRDPIDRAYSHWWHRYTARNESLCFEDAIDQNLERIDQGIDFTGDHGPEEWRKGLLHDTAMASTYRIYLDCGLYAQQLRRYRETFPAEQLHVALYDDLIANAEGLVRDLWSFLGVSRDAALHDLAPLNQAPASFDSALLQRSSGLLIRSGLSAWLPPRLRAAGRALFSRERAAPVVRPPLAPATRARLVEYYREPNRELGELLGRSLASWGA